MLHNYSNNYILLVLKCTYFVVLYSGTNGAVLYGTNLVSNSTKAPYSMQNQHFCCYKIRYISNAISWEYTYFVVCCICVLKSPAGLDCGTRRVVSS